MIVLACGSCGRWLHRPDHFMQPVADLVAAAEGRRRPPSRPHIRWMPEDRGVLCVPADRVDGCGAAYAFAPGELADYLDALARQPGAYRRVIPRYSTPKDRRMVVLGRDVGTAV